MRWSSYMLWYLPQYGLRSVSRRFLRQGMTVQPSPVSSDTSSLFGHNGNRFDFDHQLFTCQFSNLYQCAGRGILAVILAANVTKRLDLRHVGYVRIDLNHV